MFEPEMVAVLEQARGLGQGGAVMVESAEFDYIVDLDAMEQENQRTGNVRKVQRLDTGGAEPVRNGQQQFSLLLAVGSHAAVATVAAGIFISTTVASKTNKQTAAGRSRSRSPLTTTTKTCAACASQGRAHGGCPALVASTSSAATASAAPSTR